MSAVAFVAGQRGHDRFVWGALAFVGSVLASLLTYLVAGLMWESETASLILALCAPAASVAVCALLAYASTRIDPPRRTMQVEPVAVGVDHRGGYRELVSPVTQGMPVSERIEVTPQWLVVGRAGQADEKVAYRSISQIGVAGEFVSITWLDEVGEPRNIRVTSMPPDALEAQRLAAKIQSRRPRD